MLRLPLRFHSTPKIIYVLPVNMCKLNMRLWGDNISFKSGGVTSDFLLLLLLLLQSWSACPISCAVCMRACCHSPINADWVQVQVCPSKWINTDSSTKCAHACKEALELLYVSPVCQKWCQIRIADVACRPRISAEYTASPALSFSSER